MTYVIYAGRMPDRPGHAPAKYRLIADELRAEIGRDYQVDDQLPTKMELVRRFGVAVNTVERAIEVLRLEGYVESRQGSGMYVISTEATPSDDFTMAMKALDELRGEVRQLRERVEDLERRR